MIARVRSVTDQEQSQFVTDAEIQDWLNQGVIEVWRRLTTADPNRGLSTATISATSGTTEYALPADFMAFRGLDFPIGGGRYVDVEPYAFEERNQLTGRTLAAGATAAPCKYLVIRGDLDNSTTRLSLLPDPGTADYRLWYVAVPEALSVTSGFDGIAGFEDYPVYHACVEVRGKAEEDPSKELLRLQRIEEAIREEAPRRHRTGVQTIARVRNRRYAARFPA